MSNWSIILSGQVIPLDSAEYHRGLLTVGRAEDCDIVIHSRGVSRHHAEILRRELPQKGFFEYFICDMSSSNGTWQKIEQIDKQGQKTFLWREIEAKIPVKISSGACIRFGDTEITFTFAECLEETGQMYLAEVLNESVGLYENNNAKNEDYDGEERRGDKRKNNNLISQIVDLISRNNPFHG